MNAIELMEKDMASSALPIGNQCCSPSDLDLRILNVGNFDLTNLPLEG